MLNFLLTTMVSAPVHATPALPSVVETGRVLASTNDWRAILIFAMFIFAGLFGLLVWGGIVMSGLGKAMDKVADSLWALKLALATERAASDKEIAEARHEREMAQLDRNNRRNRRGGANDDKETT